MMGLNILECWGMTMWKLSFCLTAVLWLFASCGTEGDAISGDTGEPGKQEVVAGETVLSDTGAELAADAGQQEIPTAPEVTLDLPDLSFDLNTDVGPVPGGLGYPCVGPSQCDSGFCIHTPDGQQCTVTCLEDCPLGWECLQHQPSLPDEIYICAPTHMNLCKPCEKNSDCLTNGVDLGDKCVGYGGAGSFCGATCMGAGDCPGGYECKQVLDVWGSQSSQCILEDGECACQAWFVDEGAMTACENSNQHGVCAGNRTCTPQGLTPCDAAVPAKELCNGLDDDCDEEVDEEAGGASCYVENQYGSCPGAYVCDDGDLVCDADQATPETCDGVDNNCDGKTDENYPDSDGDGLADCLEFDKDGDGVMDVDDNCPNAKNPGQEDFDLDMAGDACDPDDDNDMSADTVDCGPLDPEVKPGAPEVCNGKDDDCDKLIDEGFPDSDADALANCIDEDDDNDNYPDLADCAPQDAAIYPGATEVCDGKDNDCDFDVDESFPDIDGDGKADCVDGDKDGDGVANDDDNCPKKANPQQEDSDGDGTGDVCDPDPDGDGIPEGVDNCPGLSNPGQKDLDGDGVGDLCDADIDGDGFPDDEDNCPLVANEGQLDSDEDGVGDACDDDQDGDGDPDATDCAPENPYVSQAAAEVCDGLDNNCNGQVDEGFKDTDLDGLRDCVDPDDDNDGDSDPSDCMPLNAAVFTGAPEKCNWLDDDCNGEIDDELGKLACGKGQCFHSVDACVNGVAQVCDPMAGAAAETCDKVDNDCDGLVDEDLGVVFCGKGACQHSEPACTGGKPTSCNPLAGAEQETCDAADNDCDGKVDEELGTTTCGLGECTHTVANCLGGVPQECDPMAGAKGEVCDGLDNNCDGKTDEGYQDTDLDLEPDCTDNDDDGDEDPDITDCAPADPAVHHLAVEVCDGIDNNCAGGVDEEDALGCQPHFLDTDGDGHGTGDARCLCEAKGLYKALVDDDCDNLNPWVFPGATELCDKVDNNCNNETDEDGATGCSWFFADADSDGFGSGDPNCVCLAPGQGWSVLSGDCDEEESGIHPGALELCDETDNDCDGGVDETFDLDIDPQNCGMCGFICQPNNATGKCEQGKCLINQCLEGYDDCNAISSDGCEIQTSQDTSNCGVCKKVCNLPHAVALCVNGTCQVGQCDEHYSDNDGIPETGCEKPIYGLTEDDPALTCQHILEFNPLSQSGVFWVDPHENGAAFQVYCDMTTDGGGWTLIEMQAGNTALDATYWSPSERNVSALTQFASNANVAARLGATEINALFKHSKGHVQHRYNNNTPGFMLTDVFGSATPTIISGGTMDIAKALRGESGHVGGFCNFYGGTGFTCCNNKGAGMNWRRYNSYKTDNLWCSDLHPYVNNGCNANTIHGPLGDSYSCSKSGQRDVAGHMWWWYGQGGVPCAGYAQYQCYGSRWIK